MQFFAEGARLVIRGTSFSSRGPLKSKGGWKTSIHYNAEPATAELLLRIIFSVSQLIIYGAIADWCQELAQRVEAHSPQSTGTLVAKGDNDPASQVPSEGCIEANQRTTLESSSPRKLGATTRMEIRKSCRRSSINKSLRRRWFYETYLSIAILYDHSRCSFGGYGSTSSCREFSSKDLDCDPYGNEMKIDSMKKDVTQASVVLFRMAARVAFVVIECIF